MPSRSREIPWLLATPMTHRIALGGLDLALDAVRFNPDAQYANSRDVQQLLSGDNHGDAPGDDSDSLTTIYWGIPRQFPKTLHLLIAWHSRCSPRDSWQGQHPPPGKVIYPPLNQLPMGSS